MSKRGAKDIAEERVDVLFEEAAAEAKGGADARARRYVDLALRMSERHKVRASHKRTYCPQCHTYFVPPRTVRVRTRQGRVSMTCLSCGHVLRYPVRAEKGG